MKVKEIMDKNFIAVSQDMGIVEASIKMESHKKFTTPVLDDKKRLRPIIGIMLGLLVIIVISMATQTGILQYMYN